MKPPFACLAAASLALASCGKSEKKTPSEETGTEARPQHQTAAERLTADRPAPRTTTTFAFPENASMVRPKGVSSSDTSWEQLTGQQMLEQFKQKGIAGMPHYVAEQIIGDAASGSTPDDQIRSIIDEAAAWHHVDRFRTKSDAMPDPHKGQLIDMLTKKHGDSWQAVAAELDEHVTASNQVMELRLKGIPGMTPEETEDLIITAMERLLPDYKAILEVAKKHAGE